MNAALKTYRNSPDQSINVRIHEVDRLMNELIHSGGVGGPGLYPRTIRAVEAHLASGGQRIRARLALHCSRALGLDSHNATRIAATVELLHNASLVHDDLQDQESIRRGAQTVWAAHGTSVAVCSGDLLLSAAYGALAGFTNAHALPQLLRLVHGRVAQTIRGQCLELSAKNGHVRDLAYYEKIAACKSGALLCLAMELPFAGSSLWPWMELAGRAAESFGIGYQILDDLEDQLEDGAGSDSPRCFNIIHVLSQAGHGETATEVARDLALRKLREAEETGNSLPNGSGTLLAEYARMLANRV